MSPSGHPASTRKPTAVETIQPHPLKSRLRTLYETNTARLAALQPWIDSYNHQRPHTALDGLTPSQPLRQQR